MTHSSDDTPTGPIGRQAQQARPQPAHTSRRPAAAAAGAAGDPTRRWNTVRNLSAAVLLIGAVLLPWNLYFGIGIPDSKTALFGVLGVVTLLSLVSLAVRGWLRIALNVPYLLSVLGFVVFDVFETIRSGGTVQVPGGVGPGAWLGISGALLAAQPAITGAAEDDTHGRWTRSAKLLGYASIVVAALSFAFNLFWRVRYALQSSSGASEFGKQNIAVIATAVVYGLVALAAVLVASGWVVRATNASRLATIALGASTLIAGILVWSLPIGRDIDAFHGIAQNTSTAGVGYEGYLAWAAAAAIFGPRTLFGYRHTPSTDERPWRTAARNGLLLIALWCVGSVLMRATDLAVAVSLNYPFSRYDTMTLAGFDLATAVLAVWLRMNLADASVSARLISSLSGLVVTLSIARVVVGVVLAPRFQEPPDGGGWNNPVYGNDLAQQITSTFDVVLCGLALGILAAAIITGHLAGRRLRRRQRRAARARDAKPPVPTGAAAATTRIRVGPTPPPSAAATTRIPTGATGPKGTFRESPTTVIPPSARSPRIFRGDDSMTRQIPIAKPKIYRPPQDSP